MLIFITSYISSALSNIVVSSKNNDKAKKEAKEKNTQDGLPMILWDFSQVEKHAKKAITVGWVTIGIYIALIVAAVLAAVFGGAELAEASEESGGSSITSKLVGFLSIVLFLGVVISLGWVGVLSIMSQIEMSKSSFYKANISIYKKYHNYFLYAGIAAVVTVVLIIMLFIFTKVRAYNKKKKAIRDRKQRKINDSKMDSLKKKYIIKLQREKKLRDEKFNM
jgi:cbb3-type cytochrome oxidase subunit 3